MNELIREALHPYPDRLAIASKAAARPPRPVADPHPALTTNMTVIMLAEHIYQRAYAR